MVGDEIRAVGIINQMLKEDTKDHRYVYRLLTLELLLLTHKQIFRISIYFAREDTSQDNNHGSEGDNNRVRFHKGRIKLETLLDSLMVGRCGDDEDDEDSNQMARQRGRILVTSKKFTGVAD